jgi:hypothetical protein
MFPMSGADGACPVCGRVAGPETQCRECGWALRVPLRAGPVTTEMRQEFTARLDDARRQLDTRVAARIQADPGPYQRYIRGGPPNATQWAAAQQAACQDVGDATDDDGLCAALARVLDGLQLGAETAIVEVGAEGVTITKVSLDRFGSPRLDRCAEKAWTAILPMLSTAELERHFQLAGAISQLDRRSIWDHLRRGLPQIPGGGPLVICRTAGWLIPEWAASVAAIGLGASLVRTIGTVDSVPAGTFLATLADGVPLRCAYSLMVAVVDSGSGEVDTQTRELFGPGAVPGAEADLSLRRLPSDHEDTALAIFAGDGDLGEPLALYSVPLPDAPSFEFQAILEGPGRVRIVQPDDAVTHPRSWAEVRARIPHRVDVATVPGDLVCAVELSGPADGVRTRLRLVRRLLELMATEYPDPAQLRVAVLTCTAHRFEPAREYLPVVRGKELGPALDAAAWLSRQTAADVGYPLAAPIEDLLHEASLLLAGSRPDGRAPRLLTVAGRRPHPYPQGDERPLRCPLKYRWRDIVGQLTGPITARCVAVADALPGDDVLNAIWRNLGPAGLHALPDATPRLIAEDLGLLVRNLQRIPVPLLNSE